MNYDGISTRQIILNLITALILGFLWYRGGAANEAYVITLLFFLLLTIGVKQANLLSKTGKGE